jgi:hypothetical protein
MNKRENCERASDLIAFVYGEADERETRDFQLHLQQCSICREEVASFGVVRESITAWRDQALAGFVSTPAAAQPQRKSALAALRQFFDLSPLWLKGATAFAAVMFCVLAGLVLFRGNNNHFVSTNTNPGAVYTEQDVDRILQEALERQQKAQLPPVKPPRRINVVMEKPKNSGPSSTQSVRSRRPLSKAEREQLAAELRLLATGDDATLQLLGDRINQ